MAAEHGSWAKAAAYYHSQNPARYRGYRSKVREIWAQEREKYLLALDQLRTEKTAALGLTSLIRVDAPVPVATLAQVDDTDPLLPLNHLGFGRAGPVRQQISTHSQIAAR
jgi:hypothetical protein